ncbi:hypothetical protein CAOG_02009 [Capsaspora owczarzaki ATCC 30864]|uniref:4-nitrophenylphosphatase n=1 Tax=Capsaspora owczarzaki (strain ATCC 30864) TaxID=595528 RepID=A0A0D2U6H7_CAPO3|nr:hypothetical protein CAOG_02009 [Capsaspora owczarzaki ATCC 30864]KJE90751.1 hypothetical protein, variant [Capsaspora owczarzaki ATCC 30864]|eukprot:XP_004348759.1 hypothetical protein CAOG_02009 [Capsaspora owczarzaki ATCC 30864]
MSATPVPQLGDFKAYIASIDTFILDCDGVIWQADKLIPGVKETLQALKQAGKRVVFLTNNSSKSRAMYVAKFTSLGLDVSVNDIFGSSFAAADYLRQIKFDKKAYVLGAQGLLDELTSVGVQYVGGYKEDTVNPWTSIDQGYVEDNPEIGAVVVGFDPAINYFKLARAYTYIQQPGCLFIATNHDSTFPAKGGRLLPGTGTIVSALEVAHGSNALVMGKPSHFMLDCVKTAIGYDPARTVMVGDRLDTDIQFGLNGNLHTLLVLTGVTSLETLQSTSNAIRPEFYTPSFADLHAGLRGD